jgi:hypothetical protein
MTRETCMTREIGMRFAKWRQNPGKAGWPVGTSLNGALCLTHSFVNKGRQP